MNPAILVIDVIHDFVYGKFGSERGHSILPPLKNLLDTARNIGVPVVYVTDAHLPHDHEFQIWGEHAVQGTLGAQIVPEITPQEGDHRIPKRRYSCFYSTGLDALLRELGTDTLALTGLVTNICIQHTAADAYYRGYTILVPRDTVQAQTDEDHEAALRTMEGLYGAETTTTAELIQKLKEA